MERGETNMLKNEGSCNDGKVVLSKRYKASDMESRKDTSVLESRMVHARSNKRQSHESERINSSSSSSSNHFIIKNLESTQRERQKSGESNRSYLKTINSINGAKGSGSCRWEYRSVVRGKLNSSGDSHLHIEGRNSPVESFFKMGRESVNEVSTSGRMNESDSGGEEGLEQFPGFPGLLVSYPPCSEAFREFCKAKGAIGGKWGKCVEFAEYGLSLSLTNLANGERKKKVRRITPEDVLQFYGVKNFKASGGSYFCVSFTRRRLFDLNLACRTWNNNVIWVKGNYLQRDDEALLDLRFRSVKQSVKSTVEMKESLLDEVAEEKT
ncbi:hypothetical protein GIB67_007844 [Kingdonia uniflora]|uniref:Uncharacterized protein n=1 Tax=Kingdonia uniflora TaxID=39325 RepID=A0A7J7N239_9MAGN|nr:hypothetical protein GIB67_007844 [Kingdonia uniflora]